MLLGQKFGGILDEFPKCLQVYRVARSTEQHSWSSSVINDEVCNNMFPINVSAISLLSMYLETAHGDLCATHPRQSPLRFCSAASENRVSVGESQPCLTVKVAQPGRKQKCPGEQEGIKLKTLQLWLLELNDRETLCEPNL